MEFKYPYYLLFLLLLIPYIIWLIIKSKRSLPDIFMPTVSKYRFVSKTWRTRLVNLPSLLHIIYFISLVIIIARPQINNSSEDKDVEGIDIMLSVDISTSMLTQDFKPNRVEALKAIAKEFIGKRPNDNIGLTLFAGEAFTQCPLTTDHDMLIKLYDDADDEMAGRGTINDGTAIGDGIMNSLLRLRESKTKSKVIILLTDGVHNCGNVSPQTAAEIARQYNVRIYTIGIGRNGMAPFPIGYNSTQMVPVEIDEKTMTKISEETGGKYFRAEENQELSEIYDEIDKMERTKLSSMQHYKKRDIFEPFALVAFICLLSELLINILILKRLP